MAEGKFEVAKAYVTIVPSMKNSRKTIASELTGITDSASEEAGRSGGLNFSNAFANVVKVSTAAIGSAIGAAAAGIATITKQAVEAYGNYEQLVGGVKKLFGDDFQAVMDNAANAYQTAGMSANTYMETVTSFSGSLIQSLGGDTAEAAKVADIALKDMSDNYNTFGGDLESVMNAYKGFSRDNFAMLDNLRLGYAGTKDEMIRLINDSGILEEEIDSLDNVSFAQMIEAIHEVQDQMNIAGTTANEANTTIQGSLNMTKGAWDNLVAGLANPDADLGQLMDNLVVSIVGDKEGEGLLNQLAPAITNALTGIGTVIERAMPIISEQLPVWIDSLLPTFISATTSLFTSLVGALPTILNILTTQLPVVLGEVFPAMLNVLPVVISSVSQLVTQLVTWLSQSGNTQMLVNSVLQVVSFTADAIAESLPVLLPALVSIIGQIATELTTPSNVEMIIDSAMYVLGAVCVALWDSLPTILDIVTGLFDNLVNLLVDFFDWAVPIVTDGIELAVNKVKEWGANVRNYVVNWIVNILNKIREFHNNLKTGISTLLSTITNNINNIKAKVSSIVTNIINTIKQLPSQVVSIGTNLITGLWNGISSKVDWVISRIRSMGTSIINAVKRVFGVASPSKVMMAVGDFMAQGLGIGWEEGIDDVKADMMGAADGLTASMTTSITAYGANTPTLASGSTYNGGAITINVYGAEGQDVNSLTDTIAQKLGDMTRRKELVYA